MSISLASKPQVILFLPCAMPRTVFFAIFPGGVEKYFMTDLSGIFSVCERNIPVMLNPGQTVKTLTFPIISALSASE